jgi:hypothetical protein
MSHQVQLSPAASHRPTAVLDPAGHAAKPPACRGRCPPLSRPDMRRIVSHLGNPTCTAIVHPRQRFPDEPGTATAGPPWPASVPLLRRSLAACTTALLRPEEAIVLRLADCDLPRHGWGMLTLTRAAPRTAKAWTGSSHDQRDLKHRPESPSRPSWSPCSTTTSVHAQVKQDH